MCIFGFFCCNMYFVYFEVNFEFYSIRIFLIKVLGILIFEIVLIDEESFVDIIVFFVILIISNICKKKMEIINFNLNFR